MAALLAQTPQVQTRPPQAGEPRTEAPLHPRPPGFEGAGLLSVSPHAFEAKGSEARPRRKTGGEVPIPGGGAPPWAREQPF